LQYQQYAKHADNVKFAKYVALKSDQLFEQLIVRLQQQFKYTSGCDEANSDGKL